MTTAIYLRVSSRRQAEANSVTAQRSEISRWLKAKGIKDTVEYVDDGVTGTTMARPAFERMTRAVLAGDHEMVVAYSLSRLGRTVAGLAPWCDQLRRRGVEIVLVKDSIDGATPMGRCFMTIMMALAEMENEQRREACQDGIRASEVLRDGKWGIAHPSHPLHHEVDWARLPELKRRRLSVSAICRELGCSRSAYYKRAARLS